MRSRGQRDGRSRSPCHGHCHENEDRNQGARSEQDAAYEYAMDLGMRRRESRLVLLKIKKAMTIHVRVN